MKETWYSYLRDEAEKDRKQRERRKKKKERINTKAFWGKQTFGPAVSANKQRDEKE